MSKYEQFIIEVKNKCSKTWCNFSQERLLNILLSQYKTQKIINVFGGPGTGKTFLGWVLEKEGYGQYIVNKDSLLKSTFLKIVLDNAPIERDATRALRVVMVERNIDQIVLLTRKPVDEYVPKLNINFTSEDREKFKNSLFNNCNLQIVKEEEYFNMHQMVLNNL